MNMRETNAKILRNRIEAGIEHGRGIDEIQKDLYSSGYDVVEVSHAMKSVLKKKGIKLEKHVVKGKIETYSFLDAVVADILALILKHWLIFCIIILLTMAAALGVLSQKISQKGDAEFITNLTGTDIPVDLCVKISTPGVHRLNFDYKKNIKAAIELIREYSPDEYGLLCRHVKIIEIKQFTKAYGCRLADGCYLQNSTKTSDGTGHVLLKPHTASNSWGPARLSALIVHEACRAHLAQTQNNKEEELCERRADAHWKRLPKEIT